MSENEIKPVAWVDLECWKATNDAGESFFTDYQDEETVALYEQSAIDALTKQIRELKTMLSIAEFQRKEMQAERDEAFAAADSKAGWEWKKRAEKAEAERDAAVADAERLRRVIHYALAQHYYGGHPRQNHWAAHAQSELAAIDAARSHDDSPMARMAAALREKAAVERSQYDKRVQSGEWGPMPELGVEAVFCVACDGAGWDGDSRERTCQSCAGSGLAARSEGGV